MSRKEQIIQKALEIMKERGFSGLTMRDLAKSLGMEAASLYNHIASKDDLLERVCFGIATQLEEGILEVNDVYFNAVERLESAVRSHVNVLTQNLDASFVFVHEWRYLSTEAKSAFIKRRNQYEKEFRKIIQLGIDEGAFEEVDPKFAVITLLSALNSLVDWYNKDGDLSPEDVSNHLFEFVCKAVDKPSQPDFYV
ncbi:MAG: TetR/AcrR family transcriptional regulator [Bacteroidia bacterium]|jgi:AcrR family transcriptional regulator|nr:TetR/AcrR family transcriptional regulator [Bacteroidia bacterium]